MHTARLLTLSPSMHCSRGGGGVCFQGVSAPGVAWFWGVSAGGGGLRALRQTPLWTEWEIGAKILPCPKPRLRAVTRNIKEWRIISVTGFMYAKLGQYKISYTVLFSSPASNSLDIEGFPLPVALVPHRLQCYSKLYKLGYYTKQAISRSIRDELQPTQWRI